MNRTESNVRLFVFGLSLVWATLFLIQLQTNGDVLNQKGSQYSHVKTKRQIQPNTKLYNESRGGK